MNVSVLCNWFTSFWMALGDKFKSIIDEEKLTGVAVLKLVLTYCCHIYKTWWNKNYNLLKRTD